MIVKEIKGNILDTDIDTIAHGVNCDNQMKSGVAKVLFTKYPEVKTGYHATLGLKGSMGLDPLGDIVGIDVGDKKIINCHTQRTFGYDGKRYVNYDAIYTCFEHIANQYDEVAIPKIGCGLGGGDWEIVKFLIDKATGDKCKIYVYHLGDENADSE